MEIREYTKYNEEEMGVDGTVWHHYVFKRED